MTSEHDVVEMFERANPVPNPELITVNLDAGRFLADVLDDSAIVPGDEAVEPRVGTHQRRWLLTAVAAAIVMLVAGLVLVNRADDSDLAPADLTPATVPETADIAPATTATTPIISPTPDNVPLDAVTSVAPLVEEGESRASPVGDITWTRVDGDATTMPTRVDFEAAGRYYGIDDDGTSWRSNDGITWTEIDRLGALPGSSVEVGDDVWTVMDQDSPLAQPRLGKWDGASFMPVDLPDPIAREEPGLRVVRRSVRLQSSSGGDLLIVESTRYGLDPANDVMEFGPDVDVAEVLIDWVDEDTYAALSVAEGAVWSSSPDFTLVAAPDHSLQITASDGMVVGQVGPWPGYDSEQLMDQLRENVLIEDRILVGSGDTFVTVPSPSIVGRVIDVADVGGRLLAITSSWTPPRNANAYGVWATDDRATWYSVDVPGFDEGTIRGMGLASNGDGAVIEIDTDPPLQAASWFTDDATTWLLTNASPYWGQIVAADDGWIKSYGTLNGPGQRTTAEYHVGVSSDAIDWQDFLFEPTELAGRGGYLGGSFSVVGNAIFSTQFTANGDRTSLVGMISGR